MSRDFTAAEPSKVRTMTKAKTDVVEADPKAGAVGAAMDYSEFGFSQERDLGQDELQIPFLNLLQSNSPVVEEESIEGAKAGRFMNSVTQELTDRIGIIPVLNMKVFVEWVPRNRGGGFVGAYQPSDPRVVEALKANSGSSRDLKVDDGDGDRNELQETFQVYCVTFDLETCEPTGFAVLACNSTKISAYRQWMTSLDLIVPKVPRKVVRTRLESKKQKNEKGSFYNFQFMPYGENWKRSACSPEENRDLLLAISDFDKKLQAGMVSVDYAQQDGGTGGTDASGSDMPF